MLMKFYHRSEKSTFIDTRMRKFIGQYQQIGDNAIESIRKYFQRSEKQFEKKEFIEKLEELKDCEYVTPFDIFSLVSESNLEIDANVLSTLL